MRKADIKDMINKILIVICALKRFRKANGVNIKCGCGRGWRQLLCKMSKESLSKELPFELRSGLSGSQACENMGHEFPSRENISTLSLKSRYNLLHQAS